MTRPFAPSAADLPGVIPLFPLPGAVLLPHGQLPLNIFEPRYLVMLEDVLRTRSRLIGMVQPVPEGPAAGGADAVEGLHRVGCAGRVVAFAETRDGRNLITLAGVSRFRIRGLVEGLTPYLRAEVDWSGFSQDLEPPAPDPGFRRAAFLDRLRRFFALRGLGTDWESLEQAEDAVLIDMLAMLCPFSVEEKQALLEAPAPSERRRMLETLIDFALTPGSDEGQMQ